MQACGNLTAGYDMATLARTFASGRPVRMRILLLCTLLVGTTACQSYVAVPVQPVTLVSVAQRSRVKVATKADVLFVIDDSFSMSGKQARLAAALQNFTTALDSLKPPVDYQVGVVTTTISERFGACGPAKDPAAALHCNSDWGAPGFACDDNLACFRSFPSAGQLYQGAGTPAKILRRGDYTAQQFSDYLAKSVKVGVDGARQPQGMEAMKLALSDPSTGFLRDGAKVLIAFFTDAEDCSDPEHRLSMLVRNQKTGEVTDRCAAESQGDGLALPGLAPVAGYVNFLRGLKNLNGDSKEVEVGAIVSLADGTQDPGLCANPGCDAECDSAAAKDRCDKRCTLAPTYNICVADCAAECHSFCGGQVGGRRYLELAFAFSGVAANVCADDASPPLSRLAAVIGIPKQVLLRAVPQQPDLLEVKVERGATVLECLPGTGYELLTTTDGTAVHFLGDCALQPDDIWDLRYLTSH